MLLARYGEDRYKQEASRYGLDIQPISICAKSLL